MVRRYSVNGLQRYKGNSRVCYLVDLRFDIRLKWIITVFPTKWIDVSGPNTITVLSVSVLKRNNRFTALKKSLAS